MTGDRITLRAVTLLLLAAAVVSVLAMPPASGAQEPTKPYLSSARRALTAPELLDAPDEWIDRSLRWAGDILDSYPPALIENPVRRTALIRLDDILHIDSAPRKPLVQQFYRARMERAVKKIEQTQLTKGMRIWKLYNHGFFVRTSTVSFSFDIVPGTNAPGFSVDAQLLERLADQSDVAFISHLHGDHASQLVAKQFLARNKPVVAVEGLWSNDPALSKDLTYLKRSTTVVHEVLVQNSRRALQVVAYPGHQGESLSVTLYLVITPDGFTVVHTGDQSGPETPGSDFDWIAQIGSQHDVDVLMPNCWTTDIKRVARGVNPKLIIIGHENEMGHSVDHREDYTQTYNHLFGTRYAFIVMGWGESYQYQK
jgi:L-ascorbate metabolism protein UlaG (beta-lactamase superfamily)